MRKANFYILFTILLILFSVSKVYASQNGYVDGTGVRLRRGPSAAYAIETTLNTGASLIILESVPGEDSACATNWYKVTYSDKTGYICGEFVAIINESGNSVASTDYETTLKEAGFPSSYWPYLVALHAKHPNWVFKTINTNISFATASSKESKIGVSLLQGNEGYRSTASSVYNYYTNTWKALDGSNWYAANEQTIKYYLDPRNWLSENTIFMFEDLSYNSSFHKKSMVTSILSTTKLSSYDSNYADHFMSAASSYDVSPVYLASRVRQEVGTSTAVISGASFTYNGKTYSRLYNPYNIGATSGADNWKKGLVWANGGETGTTLSTSYLRPWNTLEKGIKGGANYIAKGYINNRQNTIYLQKFNVANGASNVASHQYMTNIMAPSSEAKTTFSSYKTYGILEESLVFAIPVYNDMPTSTSLPNTGNPNNYLKTLQVNGTSVANFDGATTSYNFYVPEAAKTATISATKVVNSGSISGTGAVTLSGTTTTREIVVTAANGDKKTYKVNIIKSSNANATPESIVKGAGYSVGSGYLSGINIGTNVSSLITKINNQGANVSVSNANGGTNSGVLKTGDKVTINNGISNTTYTIVIYGDVNGDGKVTSIDYVLIKNSITTSKKLSGVYFSAADVNKDGQIKSSDYANVKNYIMKRTSVLR